MQSKNINHSWNWSIATFIRQVMVKKKVYHKLSRRKYESYHIESSRGEPFWHSAKFGSLQISQTSFSKTWVVCTKMGLFRTHENFLRNSSLWNRLKSSGTWHFPIITLPQLSSVIENLISKETRRTTNSGTFSVFCKSYGSVRDSKS